MECVRRYTEQGDASQALTVDALVDAAKLVSYAGDAGGRGVMDVDVIAAVAWLHSIRSEVLPDGDDGEVALQLFGLLRPVAPYLIPEEVGTWLDQNPDQATGTMPIERIYGPVVFLHALDTGQVPLLDL